MKNKLLLSLLCATAISSTGFISEGFSASVGWEIPAKTGGKGADKTTPAEVNAAIKGAITELVTQIKPEIDSLNSRVKALETIGVTAMPAGGAGGMSAGGMPLPATHDAVTGLPYVSGSTTHVELDGKRYAIAKFSKSGKGNWLYKGTGRTEKFTPGWKLIPLDQMFGTLRISSVDGTVLTSDGKKTAAEFDVDKTGGVWANKAGDTIDTNSGVFTKFVAPLAKVHSTLGLPLKTAGDETIVIS